MAVEWLKQLFASRTPNPFERLSIQIVEAQNVTITELKNEIQYLRDERRELQQIFNRVLKLEPIDKPIRDTTQQGAIGTKSWPRLQRELEAKHAKKSEDQVHAYWTKKAAEMKEASGLDDESVKAAEEVQSGRP